MKVILIKTGKAADFNDSFAARLIEQGQAVPCPAEKKAVKAEAKPKKSGKGE